MDNNHHVSVVRTTRENLRNKTKYNFIDACRCRDLRFSLAIESFTQMLSFNCVNNNDRLLKIDFYSLQNKSLIPC